MHYRLCELDLPLDVHKGPVLALLMATQRGVE
jgi:hypothetical protein